MKFEEWKKLNTGFYLTQSDKKEEKHHNAVWALAAAAREFPESIKRMIEGDDWGGHYEEFRFYKNYDEEEKKEEPEFDGIRYSVDVESLEDPVVLSYEETLYYLEIIAERYIKCNPESKEQIEKLMRQYKDTYHL